ncbi:MAG: hypothetical protein QOD76_860 [Solirubrobacteraceae bacterium]|jgi:hypothetical protein|nr:hypothetical protein [Solirubrobacteraceae bacterium]
MTDQMSTQVLPAESLRETLRLACDLAEALATQSDRAKRQAGELNGSPLAETEIDRLVNQATRVHRQCAEMMDELDTIESARPPDPEPAAEIDADAEQEDSPEEQPAGPRIGARERAIEGAVQTLILDLKMTGRSRDEIEQTLIETFGVERATEIVDGMFERVPA